MNHTSPLEWNEDTIEGELTLLNHTIQQTLDEAAPLVKIFPRTLPKYWTPKISEENKKIEVLWNKVCKAKLQNTNSRTISVI